MAKNRSLKQNLIELLEELQLIRALCQIYFEVVNNPMSGLSEEERLELNRLVGLLITSKLLEIRDHIKAKKLDSKNK